jgi:NADPH:quinone reductase
VLRRGGRLCALGAISGADARLSLWDLLHELVLTGYSSENLTGPELRKAMATTCALLASGQLSAPPFACFAMSDAAQVHSLMERNELTGRALLLPVPVQQSQAQRLSKIF